MPTRDLADGETYEMQGSGSKPYILKNTGGVYSCTCPAWRNQSVPIETRTCKHLKKLRGEAAETARCMPGQVVAAVAAGANPAEAVVEAAVSTAIAPPILLANPWDNVTDLTGWWISEKLDGVRAYWNGTDFISRLGNVYHAPDWFKRGLPEFPLDGELWIGRGAFQECVSIVRRQDKSDLWRKVRYVVFDAPDDASPFEARLERTDQAFVSYMDSVWGDDYGEIFPAYKLTHTRCEGLDHLRAELDRVIGGGGEGLMLRQPGSLYVAGRSETLLKVKRFHDAEARVTGYTAGKGKHKGKVGALEVESLENAALGIRTGIKFSVGTGLSDAERAKPPAVGAVVTFRFQELTTAGVPRFPSYVRVRTDL